MTLQRVVCLLAFLLASCDAFGPSSTRSLRKGRSVAVRTAPIEKQAPPFSSSSPLGTTTTTTPGFLGQSRHAGLLLRKTKALLPVVLVLTPAMAQAADPFAFLDGGTGVLFQATSLVFLSEIGDKTFFIASILAARASRILAFAGAFGALVLMTIASVVIGQVFHSVPDSLTRGIPIDDYVAVLSFAYFGVKSIQAALSTDDGDGLAGELQEAEEELKSKSVLSRASRGVGLAAEAFALTVAAEIGDRSQITTIALSAAQNPYVVTLGACLGHGLATGIAVLGGAFISKFVNEKQISLIAGVLFIVFAATTLVALF